ncbi:MAG TPA: Uma2 family endonuclease [Methylomirabilota bacterium]|jgi:Uma2 family endonuclease|nr:Uma2 family endonuclease [Methylomirabilota bacterium]
MSRLTTERTRGLRRVEYEALVERGFFDEERLELLDGVLVVKEPQGSRHSAVVLLIQDALARAFGARYHVRPQMPVALDERSEPEPDLCVVRGRIEHYLRGHPSTPVLVVEVSESSLKKDRLRKAALYARAEIADYWVVNLLDDVVEIYRRPEKTPGGWGYRSVRVLRRGTSITPLAARRARIRVSALLP